MRGKEIAVKHLSKDLGDFALKDINLRVESGEYFIILGPTGAGKTVLLEIIAGLHQPDKGEIWFGGEEMTNTLPEERNIGFVYQDYVLFPHLSVERNIQFGLRARGRKGEAERKIKEVMALLGISHLAQRYSHTLSGGEQQKVALARAIAVEPDVLLLDEPLAALDPRTKDYLRDELKELNRRLGVTMVHVTHDQVEAIALANRIAIVMDGRVLQVGDINEIFAEPVDEKVADFVGVGNILKGMAYLHGDGLARISVDNYDIFAMSSHPYNGEPVKAIVRPEDIILSGRPSESSAQNFVRGQIVRLSNLGPIYRVQLDNGLIAFVTKRAVEDLKLAIGKEVFALFKATAVKIIKGNPK